MKEYRFYFREPVNDGTSLGSRYRLYAFTNKKKLAKRFMEERNMDICKKEFEDIDPEDFLEHCKTHRLNLLKEDVLTSYVDKDWFNGKKKLKSVTLACTEYEITSIEELVENFMLCVESNFSETNTVLPPPYIFTSKIQKSLEALYLDKFFCSAMSIYPSSVRCQETNDYIERSDSYDAPDIIIDEVKLFINSFWFTFAKKPFNGNIQ